MTKLSLAAKAVLNAANSRNSYGPDDCLNESRWIAAATLRAAVAATQSRQYEGCWICSASDILAIAAELDTL